MAYVLRNRVKETTTTTGTGALTLSGAQTGYLSFGGVMSVGDTTDIVIEDPVTGAWEAARSAAYTGTNTLSRGTFEASSTGSVVSFGSGAKNVYMTVTASSLGRVPVPLTSGTTVNTNCYLGTAFTLTLATNATLANPTGAIAGWTYMWIITQDGTGSRTLAYGTNFKFASRSVPALSTAAGSVDVLTAYFDGTNFLTAFTPNFG